jgi:hypothetical protein
MLHAAIPVSELGGSWPQGLPLQIHMMEADELAVRDGDLDVARELADTYPQSAGAAGTQPRQEA